MFAAREATATQFWRGMVVAAIASWLFTWVGLHAGRAMQKVRR
jgi:hypothetical protein